MKIIIVALSAACAAVLLLALRAPDVFVSPQMWAEDGVVFWQEQYTLGWRALGVPYAGYLLIATRLAAGCASWFDVALAPRFYASAAIALSAWSAATAATSLRPPLLGFASGASLLLAPHITGEIFGTITNIQWLLAPTLALVLAAPRAEEAAVRANQMIFAGLAALTGPFSILLLPVAALRFHKLRDPIAVLVIVAGLTQLTVLAFNPPAPIESGPGRALHLGWQIMQRAFGPGRTNLVATMTLLIASLAVTRQRRLRAGLIFFAVATMFATFVKFLPSPQSLDPAISGPRYFYPVTVAILWCALSMIFTNALGVLIGLVALALTAATYPRDTFKRAPLADMQWERNIQGLGERELTIPINPPGWKVVTPVRPSRR